VPVARDAPSNLARNLARPLRIHPDEPYACLSPPKPVRSASNPAHYVTCFRIITLDGAPDAELIDALWNDYATPPEVSVD